MLNYSNPICSPVENIPLSRGTPVAECIDEPVFNQLGVDDFCGLQEDTKAFALRRQRQNRTLPTAPVIVPSVAARAGMDQFIYMRGRSGRRYVFSAIRAEQLPLYNDAVLAVADKGATSPLWTGVTATMNASGLSVFNKATLDFYIHLLARNEAERIKILADLAIQSDYNHLANNDSASSSSLRSLIPMDRNCSTVWKI